MVVSRSSLISGDGRLEISLEHAVELEALAGGDAEGAVRVTVGDRLEGEVLGRGDRAGGNGHADHERVRLSLAARLEIAPLITGVLLVGPVKFQKLHVVVMKVRRIGRQRLGDRAPQMPAMALGDFDFGFRFSGHRLRSQVR